MEVGRSGGGQSTPPTDWMKWTYPLPPYTGQTGQTGLLLIQDQSVVKIEDTN